MQFSANNAGGMYRTGAGAGAGGAAIHSGGAAGYSGAQMAGGYNREAAAAGCCATGGAGEGCTACGVGCGGGGQGNMSYVGCGQGAYRGREEATSTTARRILCGMGGYASLSLLERRGERGGSSALKTKRFAFSFPDTALRPPTSMWDAEATSAM